MPKGMGYSNGKSGKAMATTSGTKKKEPRKGMKMGGKRSNRAKGK